MSNPFDQRPGSRIGVEDRVSSAWTGYDPRSEVERSPREVHYDVLRESGFDRDRARQISAASADEQQRLLERHRGELAGQGIRSSARRIVTPHFGPNAGQLCRVLTDGSTEPIGSADGRG